MINITSYIISNISQTQTISQNDIIIFIILLGLVLIACCI